MAATADAGTQTDIVACYYDWEVLEVANASGEMYGAGGLSRPSEEAGGSLTDSLGRVPQMARRTVNPQ